MVARKKRILVPALLVVVVVGLMAWVVSTASRPAPVPPMPNPNGYDDFVKAGEMVTGTMDDYRKASAEELRAYVATNAAVLTQLRVGLSRECRAPLDLELTNSSVVLPLMRRLAFLLVANGRLAELEKRPDDAVQNYLDAIRLGNNVSRGGFMIHRLVGIACEVNGLVPLTKIALTLSSGKQHSIIFELERIDATSVTWDDIRRAENAFIRYHLRKEINPITWIKEFWEARAYKKGCLERHNTLTAQLRLLTTELALRCYRSEHGRAPLRLDGLVPKYLQHVPTDPFSNQPLVYRAQGTNWLLYSVGPDHVDDGGKPAGPTQSVLFGAIPPTTKGDLFYDSPWR